MNSCAKCQSSIPDGEEVWFRNRKSNKRILLCSQCAAELRQKRAQSEPTAAEIPHPLSSARSMPSSESSKIPIDGVLLMIIMILVIAPIIGILMGYLRSYNFIFSLVVSAFSIFIPYKGIRWAKLREPMIAGLMGLLFGFTVYSSYRTIDYVMFRNEVNAMIIDDTVAEYEKSDTEAARVVLDQFSYGVTRFIGFLQGQENMPVGRATFRSAVNADSFLAWLYRLFEVGVIIGFPVYGGMSAAKRPFCEIHDRWYDEEKSIGGIVPTRLKKALQLWDAQQFSQLGQILATYVPTPGGEVLVECCPGCKQSSPLLIIKQRMHTRNRKIYTEVLRKQFISPAQYDEITRNVAIQLKAMRMLR